MNAGMAKLNESKLPPVRSRLATDGLVPRVKTPESRDVTRETQVDSPAGRNEEEP